MAKKSAEIHALLNVIGQNQLKKLNLKKNLPRYKEAKQAILVIADVILDSDEGANVNIVEESETAISMHVESSFFSTGDLVRLCNSLDKATRVEIYPTPSGIGASFIFDGVFLKD